MNRIASLFNHHPASVGESYFEHMATASSFALALLGAGAACLVHALLPFMFTHTARRTIESLHRRVVTHRDRRVTEQAITQ